MVLDIVPNHMALAGAANRWWWDVLENGPASRYAALLRHRLGGAGRAVGVHGARAGARRPLRPRARGRRAARSSARGGSFIVALRRPRAAAVAADASTTSLGRGRGAPGRRSSPSWPTASAASRRRGWPTARPWPSATTAKAALARRLRALREPTVGVAEARRRRASPRSTPTRTRSTRSSRRQNYRLAYWRTASEELDYRRFFDITTLVGLRVEDPDVFDDTHRLVLDLVRDGDVDGLRIDHVDGLRDPAGYLGAWLAAATGGAYTVVEKILGADERAAGDVAGGRHVRATTS